MTTIAPPPHALTIILAIWVGLALTVAALIVWRVQIALRRARRRERGLWLVQRMIAHLTAQRDDTVDGDARASLLVAILLLWRMRARISAE